ncbi:MAG: Hsp33 family molecular chaperone HslO [Hyphomicrobiaceae bacterium]|nr:Hsp33 family molecular chaperone HslO [Hyphomicrobiaceae bacterium]
MTSSSLPPKNLAPKNLNPQNLDPEKMDLQKMDLGHDDDLVVPFRIERAEASGRLVRLGPAINEILTLHAYPEKVSQVIGQALLLVAMFGSMIKDRQGNENPELDHIERFILQTQSDGAINLLVADYVHPGHLRGYARFDADRLASLDEESLASQLLGKGHLAMTIDRGPDTDRYQGIVSLDNEGPHAGLSGAANHYFEQSEQLPTFIQLSMARHFDAQQKDSEAGSDGWHWRGGALMVQKLTSVGGHKSDIPDAQSSDHESEEDSWNRINILSQSLKDHELLDPLLASPDLLYRLYHEDGVRIFDSQKITAACSCSTQSVTRMLKAFSAPEQQEMVEGDGKIHITCEFCNRTYELEPPASS